MRAINTFWNWFQDNNQTIKNMINETPKNQKHISFWINKNLSYYCKEIDFMIVFPKKPNDKAEMIISANGNPNYFKQVIALVDYAPTLKTWKFTAFIQPLKDIEKVMDGLDKPYIFQDITLKASELKFRAINYEENLQKLDIIIFFKQFNIHCNNKTLNQAIYIILQDLLGEKSLYQNINLIHLAQMPDNEDDLIFLCDLQSYIDTFHSCVLKK
jgi:hypothetical protein